MILAVMQTKNSGPNRTGKVRSPLGLNISSLSRATA